MTKLVWEQDFLNSTTGLKLWNIREGNDLLDHGGNPVYPGWGNGEQQFYTGHSGNLYISEAGLNLCARREAIETDGRRFAYTSARLDTRGHFSFCCGKLVVRAKLPVGQGLWPAIWLLPQDEAYGPWPASGEIDILEAKGRLPRHIAGTLHYGPDLDHKVVEEFTYELEGGTINEFRDYALEWDAGSIRWLVDGHCFAERRLQQGVMPFDKPFYLLLNLAVGGWYDNAAVDEAALPAVMTVSGIRLYQ
ncbi:glycoside hydrolase family 16 protein [Paenibacillus sp. S150]|uniref:glycoside hydrolase family 16 protein n=1 Tax=Paenibacillus sp. S150 TaxID=2749826 RepID=UPI001C58F5B8|nr:glycoside hydrolase family 16 protein [Paenibacillus sp. S150]MBW4083686.1 glycoside hydrolase family 16 protein [Paenibacillus sp. S150]